MIQLVYASVATRPLTGVEIEALRCQAQRNNLRDELTGIMVTRGDHFLQALEGAQATVENTFLRIIVDPRHHSLTLLSRRSITRREFGDWDMAHCATLANCPAAAHFMPFINGAPDKVRDAFLEPIG